MLSSRQLPPFSRNYNLKIFFSLGEQFFEDQNWKSGFALCRKILARATEYYVASQIWSAGRKFDNPALEYKK